MVEMAIVNSLNTTSVKMIAVRQCRRLISSQTKSLRYQNLNDVKIEDQESHQHSDFVLNYKEHYIPTSILQRAMLTVGSAAVSLLDPTRGDMIACLGETVGTPALQYMLDKMKTSDEGRRILVEQPRINSNTVPLDALQKLPENTLGRKYSDFLNQNNVTPDSRLAVQFVEDVELAYVVQRYREVHDLFHTILGMPTNMLGEVTVKWVEAIQTKLPMCIGGALFGPIRLRSKQRQLYLQYYLPWAIRTGSSSNFLLNTYFEKRWEQPIEDLYKELNITPLVIKK